jgi:hypothetical protein
MGLTDGAMPALSWKGLVENGFAYGVQKGRITKSQATAWKRQLGSSDLDDLLAAAEFVGRKLDAPAGDLYARWFASVFEHATPTNRQFQEAIGCLIAAKVPLCTLNYDTLLEATTGLASINAVETGKVTAWIRGGSSGILHLHGLWTTPESCILGIRDYEGTLRDEVRDHLQRSLASFRRLLFIGCGDTFSDPNFSALIKWLRHHLKAATLQHYALVREDEVGKRHADPAWHGFVEPVSYGSKHNDLPAFVCTLTGRVVPSDNLQHNPTEIRSQANEHAKLLTAYREFLLKDCGQMTIEGVRADMDTAQRRFDLERLFVPLNVIPSPPEIAENDPLREEKLRHWQEEQQQPQEFGKVFSKHKRLALLALPGGGKTLLLKRLAVAYADPKRRKASPDGLPKLDLTPVLVRCREWREHIHRPILTLLRNLPDITGHPGLTGIADALLPLFESGKVLLLIDGLDEIHDNALRSTFVEQLEKFLEDYPSTRLVVTSREAGFGLVAPVLARFCNRWRVAPLADEAISTLCEHWHRLMGGESREAEAEAKAVTEHLTRNESLRRLAENPLMLTMLLVVKHGAGRLPPDRVSLYGRAVEVLLDTWNIKGHAPLNPKEAVPQLAYVALELMRAGKQTATERELLSLLEEARENVPQIARYAKDTPHEFLRRVELRSSLVIEAGHQVEGRRTVPFYQFRHLTFQEYLAGVAIAEGHYRNYTQSDSVLTPLAPYITSEEWKEVVPMTAVLARKQAEPLIAALVAEGNELRSQIELSENEAHLQQKLRTWTEWPPKMPAPVARLIGCLVEEAEASSSTLISALQLVAFFARGCQSKDDDWAALSRGLYGEEFLHQAWLLYESMDWPGQTWLITSCAQIACLQRPRLFWFSLEGIATLNTWLASNQPEELARGLFIIAGLYWSRTDEEDPAGAHHRLSDLGAAVEPRVEQCIFHQDFAISTAAMWSWALIRHFGSHSGSTVDPTLLDHLLSVMLDPEVHPHTRARSGFALSTFSGQDRQSWTPQLTSKQVQQLKQFTVDETDPYPNLGVLVVAFHARNVWSNVEIAKRLGSLLDTSVGIRVEIGIRGMLKQLGRTGLKYLQPQS